MRSVIESNGRYYLQSLLDGAIYFIFEGSLEFCVKYSDKNGYVPKPILIRNKDGLVLIKHELNLKHNDIISLNKLRVGK